MPGDPQTKPSFSAARKWGIGLQVLVLTCLVFSVLGMVNYISREYYVRFQVSGGGQVDLSPMTLSLLKSLTNQVHITLYYDKKDQAYDLIYGLLRKYELEGRKHVSVQVVDYLLDAGTAQKVKEQYQLGGMTNQVIFDSGGTSQLIPGGMLAEYTYEVLPENKGFRAKFISFRGEKAFTAALLAVIEPKARHAYVLQGHGEHDIASGNDEDGYLRFAEVLNINHIEVHRLNNLVALEGVPTNCDLLIIPGPRRPLPEEELKKIDQYLDRSGSRLLALLADTPPGQESGLEGILRAKWGMHISSSTLVDPPDTASDGGLLVGAFGIHPVSSPLMRDNLEFGQPRVVEPAKLRNQPADAPHVQVLAQTEPTAHFKGDEEHKRQFPVMVAVEKSIQGVASERGPTRMVVVGDSYFLANHWISAYANGNFANYAINWLVDRTPLIQIGPRPVNEYTLRMSKSQLQSTELILLAGMPGGILLLGCLVWFRRRR